MKHPTRKLNRYKVHVGFTKFIVDANNQYMAKSSVWESIKNHYTYGWKNRDEFMARVKVEQIYRK